MTIHTGTRGRDYIEGSIGNDEIYGLSGDDRLYGRAGNDIIIGGGGNDWLEGGTGNDVLSGGGGDDYLSDRSGNNLLKGGIGNDRLVSIHTARDGANRLLGGDGDDHITASVGDTVLTGEGRDTVALWTTSGGLIGFTVGDFTAGDGGDTFDLNNILDDLIDLGGSNPFGSGHLRLHQDGKHVLLQVDADGGGDNWSTLVTLNNLTESDFTADNFGGFNPNGEAIPGGTYTGTRDRDIISGSNGNDEMYGLSGADRLLGQAGNDIIIGGGGNDWLEGGVGNDVLSGGGGDDYLSDNEGNNLLKGGIGNDRLVSIHTARDGANRLLGGDGDDHITASVGDTVLTGEGRDTVRLWATSPDQIGFTVGDFTAGNGGDTFDLNLILGHFIDLGGSNPFGSGHLRLHQDGKHVLLQVDTDGGGDNWSTLVTLNNLTASDFTADNFGGFNPNGEAVPGGTYTGTRDRDIISGSNGNDEMYGLSGDDRLLGQAGNDIIIGGGGNDWLEGGVGNDVLSGGGGDDYLSDNEGNNLLKGGIGNDRLVSRHTVLDGANKLIGGEGNDHITASAGDSVLTGEGRDTIELWATLPGLIGFTVGDFTAGDGGDTFDLNNILDDLIGLGGSNPFGSGHLRLHQDGKHVLLQVDTDGGGDNWSTLVTLNNLTESDFTADNFGGFNPNGADLVRSSTFNEPTDLPEQPTPDWEEPRDQFVDMDGWGG